MDELLSRLRILSQDAGDTGTDEQREKVINRFTEDLRQAAHPRLIKTLQDSTLRTLYLSWGKHIIAGEGREDILNWMAVAVLNPLGTPLVRAAQPEESNVVSMFR